MLQSSLATPQQKPAVTDRPKGKRPPGQRKVILQLARVNCGQFAFVSADALAHPAMLRLALHPLQEAFKQNYLMMKPQDEVKDYNLGIRACGQDSTWLHDPAPLMPLPSSSYSCEALQSFSQALISCQPANVCLSPECGHIGRQAAYMIPAA